MVEERCPSDETSSPKQFRRSSLPTPLVIQLQRRAVESGIDVTALVREALVVATKLSRIDLQDWLNHELHGYAMPAAVPKYRKVRAELKARMNGLVPYIVPPKIADVICDVEVRDPIGTLCHALAEGRPGSPLSVPLSPKQIQTLMAMQDTLGRYEPVRTVARNQIAGIVEAVKTTVLEWALRLEQEGILGEGLTFSEDELIRASRSNAISINTFQGILGDISHSTVSQEFSLPVSPGDATSLEQYVKTLGVDETEAAELGRAVQSDPRPERQDAFGPRVSAWLGRAVKRAAGGGLKVGIAAAGDLLARAIAAYYDFPTGE